MEVELNCPNSVTLVSTMKSGTHWMRYLLANYMNIMVRGDEAQPVKYEQLQNTFSPTELREALNAGATVQTSSEFPFHGISNIMWQHVGPNLKTFMGKILFIHRNPLDYLVSRYHYDRDLWESEGRDVSDPGATIPWSLKWYCENLRFMRELSKDRVIISVTYEDLKRDPLLTMSIVWRSLGVPVNYLKLAKSVDYSTANRIRKEEDERGSPIVGSTSVGRFVRDSSIGQWKTQLQEEDVQKAEQLLKGYGFNLAQFIIE